MSELENFKRKVAARNPLSVLESKLAECISDLNDCKSKYVVIRRTLDNVETNLIYAKEAKRRAEEELEEYKRTRILETSVDDATRAEVDQYRAVMPKYMALIAHEPPLRYMTISELETSGNA